MVNLPPAQIYCAGTPKNKGSFFEELWLSSDMKERKNMAPRMFANEVLAQFFAAGGAKPIPTDLLLSLLVKTPAELNNAIFVEKILGVDWGDETRWVLIGRTLQNKFYIIDSGVFDDIDTMQHVDKLKLIISRESPKWVLCDAGYGKTKNQILMRAYPGKVWSVFTNSGSNMPIWNTIKELDRNPLPEEDWQYHVSINHTSMCENTENIAARWNLGICYFPEQQARMDVLLYEVSQADAEEVNTSTGKQRRFDISSAHGYAALSYALLPYAFVQDYSDTNVGYNMMTRMPRFVRPSTSRSVSIQMVVPTLKMWLRLQRTES